MLRKDVSKLIDLMQQAIYQSVKMGDIDAMTHGTVFPASFTGFGLQGEKANLT